MEWKLWVPILISIIALVFSFITWYFTWQSPYDTKVAIGRPIIGNSPSSEDPSLFYFTPIIPIQFTNIGAKGGTIEDLRLVIKTKNMNKTWVLRPNYFCDEYGIHGIQEEKREAFHPIYISGRESIFKVLLFNPIFEDNLLKPPAFSLNSSLPDEDQWTFEYYILDSSSEEYRLVQIHNFKITHEQMLNGSYIPDTDNIIQAYKLLIEKIK